MNVGVELIIPEREDKQGTGRGSLRQVREVRSKRKVVNRSMALLTWAE